MKDKHRNNLAHMHATGKEIAAIFAGALAPDQILPMTQALLDLMKANGTNSHDSRLMLLGALAALGQEATVSC